MNYTEMNYTEMSDLKEEKGDLVPILDKEDLISLVKGKSPYYDVFNDPLVKKCGVYRGGFHDTWIWNESNLQELTNVQLWNLYQTCKNSWK